MNTAAPVMPGQDAPIEDWIAFREAIEKAQGIVRAENRLGFYRPYAKQREFHTAGAMPVYERLFMAGNQLGKTVAGGAEAAMHLTGKYPDWWQGHRFSGPIVMLAGSESGELTKAGVQRLLIGPPEDESQWGTGFIPKVDLIETQRGRGVPDALDSALVRHAAGGVSIVHFKSYDQGRGKWQAATVDLVWFDEEPPEDVYSEGRTRTNATKGIVYLTFTPLLGMSNVVRRFLTEKSDHRAVTVMTINDAEHFTEDERKRIIESYEEHERDARTAGIPILGSGRVFPVADSQIVINPIQIPDHWPRLGGLDFGWDHPFAAVELAHDTDNDIIYLIREYRASKKTPAEHCLVIGPKRWGRIRWAWPHDGMGHERGSGDQMIKLFKDEGLMTLPVHATWPDGSLSLEAGVSDMLTRMHQGRWKVFNTCQHWLEEFRLYHREDGLIVKEMDDLISASRYARMMIRFARPVKPERDPFGFYGNDGASPVAVGTGEVMFGG